MKKEKKKVFKGFTNMFLQIDIHTQHIFILMYSLYAIQLLQSHATSLPTQSVPSPAIP